MIAETAKILSDGLGQGNWLADAATSLVATMGPEKLRTAESLAALAAWGFCTWGAFWAPYAASRKPSPPPAGGQQQAPRKTSQPQGYVEWLSPRAGTVLLWYALGCATSFLLFLSPLVPHVASTLIGTFVREGESARGLLFLFAYKQDSPAYGLFETAAWALAVALALAATVALSLHHGAFRGSAVRYGGDAPFDFGKAGRRAGLAFLACMLLFFTTLPEITLNWALKLVSDRTVSSFVDQLSGSGAAKK